MNIFQRLIDRFRRKKTSGEASLLTALARSGAMAAIERAEQAEEQENWQKAIEAWNEVVALAEVMPDQVPNRQEYLAASLNRRGLALGHMNRYKEAHDDFDRAISIEPENAIFWGAKADLLAFEGKSEQALETARHALKLDPEEPGARVVVEHHGQTFDQVLQDMAKDLSEKDNPALHELSELVIARAKAAQAEREKRWQDAIDVWTVFLQKGSWYQWMTEEIRAGILYDRSKAFSYAKRYKQALDDIENALSLTPGEAKFWSAKAIIYLVQENNEKAFEAARHAIMLDQNDNNAKLVLVKLVERGFIPTIGN